MEVGWVKIIILFLVFMIPIWGFNFLPVSLGWKLLFTLAVALGLYFKLGLGLDMKGLTPMGRKY